MPSIIIIITYLVVLHVMLRLDRVIEVSIEVSSVLSLICLYFHYADVFCVCSVRYSHCKLLGSQLYKIKFGSVLRQRPDDGSAELEHVALYITSVF
jgi:hypothetical protein